LAYTTVIKFHTTVNNNFTLKQVKFI